MYIHLHTHTHIHTHIHTHVYMYTGAAAQLPLGTPPRGVPRPILRLRLARPPTGQCAHARIHARACIYSATASLGLLQVSPSYFLLPTPYFLLPTWPSPRSASYRPVYVYVYAYVCICHLGLLQVQVQVKVQVSPSVSHSPSQVKSSSHVNSASHVRSGQSRQVTSASR